MRKLIFLTLLFFLINFVFSTTCIDLDGDDYNGSMTDSEGNELTYDETICGPWDCNDDVLAPTSCPEGVSDTYQVSFCGETMTVTNQGDCYWDNYIEHEIAGCDYTFYGASVGLDHDGWILWSEDFDPYDYTHHGCFYSKSSGDSPIGNYDLSGETGSVNCLDTAIVFGPDSVISCPSTPSDCNADTVACPICIHPGATEYPGDGIDSDCDGLDDPFICTTNDDCPSGEICLNGECVDSCPICTLFQEDTCAIVDCNVDADCTPYGSCTCETRAMGDKFCWFEGPGTSKNSIILLDANTMLYENQLHFFIKTKTLFETDYGYITLTDSSGNDIDINIYDSRNTIITNGLVKGYATETEYRLAALVDLNNGIYLITYQINQPCDICQKTYNINYKTLSVPISIPDNNLLIVLIFLISLIGFIKIKEKNELTKS